jgi:Cdc6-like AAA superfamily ATPase
MTMHEEDWLAKQDEVAELFSPATPINEADLIAGRAKQIGRLKSAVLERGRHAILYGERGVGKTSLAFNFPKLIPTRKDVYPVRKQALPTDTFSSLWRRVFMELENDRGRVSDRYRGEITPDDVVRELGNFSLNSIPIIILDEFDKIEDFSAKRTMSHTIKGLSDTGVNATIVIVGVGDNITLLVEEHASIKRNISEILMPRMSLAEMNEILDQRYPKVGVSITEEARTKITTLARGLPEYVHYLGRDAAVTALQARRIRVEIGDVDKAISAMVSDADHSGAEAYGAAVLSNKKYNLYRQVLLACAMAETDDRGQFAPSALIEPLTEILGRPVKIANFLAHLIAFTEPERGEVLERKGSRKAYKYRFKEPKMQPYVIMRGIADGIVGSEAMESLANREHRRVATES